MFEGGHQLSAVQRTEVEFAFEILRSILGGQLRKQTGRIVASSCRTLPKGSGRHGSGVVVLPFTGKLCGPDRDQR